MHVLRKMSAPALDAKMKGSSERRTFATAYGEKNWTNHDQATLSFELLQNRSLRINARKGPPPEWDLCNCIYWPFANTRPQPAKNTGGLKIWAAYHSLAETDPVNCRTCFSSARLLFTSWTFQSACWQMCSRTSRHAQPCRGFQHCLAASRQKWDKDEWKCKSYIYTAFKHTVYWRLKGLMIGDTAGFNRDHV